jgi:hypothetical protein
MWFLGCGKSPPWYISRGSVFLFKVPISKISMSVFEIPEPLMQEAFLSGYYSVILKKSTEGEFNGRAIICCDLAGG